MRSFADAVPQKTPPKRGFLYRYMVPRGNPNRPVYATFNLTFQINEFLRAP
jgi:hypothetical protein